VVEAEISLKSIRELSLKKSENNYGIKVLLEIRVFRILFQIARNSARKY